MNMGFSFLLASVIITGVCILICIVYMSYKISEAWHSTRVCYKNLQVFSHFFW